MNEIRSGPSEKKASRRRDKGTTAVALRNALLLVKNSGHRVSIKAVAEEAGVDPSLVHHVYPDIAEEIRSIAGRSTRTQRDSKHADLVKARTQIRELRQEVATLLTELADAASLNLTLLEQLKDLRAGQTGPKA